MVKIIHVAGKRKRAVAKATLKPGKGIVRINNQLIDNYEPQLARLKLKEPLILAGDAAKSVDINIRVSGGGFNAQAEAARLAIARALANDPEVLLADEPTGNLDSKTSKQIMEIIDKLHKEEKKTIIIVTHDKEMAKYAHRVIYLKDGKPIKHR